MRGRRLIPFLDAMDATTRAIAAIRKMPEDQAFDYMFKASKECLLKLWIKKSVVSQLIFE